MNAATTVVEDDDRFVDLVEAMDQALAAGLPASFAASVEVPAMLAGRLDGVRDLLGQLHRRWPQNKPVALQGPRQLKHYEIRHLLGQGGFGLVFLAVDTKLNREVAVKLPRLRAALAPQQRDRFVEEAKAMAGLNHPHLVAVYDRDEENGICFIVSEYCPAGNLADWLAKRASPVPALAAARLIQVLAEAIQYMHGRGVLHRDLKPANILFSDEGKTFLSSSVPISGTPWQPGPEGDWPFVPKISDFGLAQNKDSAANGSGCQAAGTLGYMAPEQASGVADAICPATDVYSLGVMLYELLTRRLPLDAATLRGLMQQQEPVPPRTYRRDLDHDLEAVCLKCLIKDPHQRYGTAADLAADLRRWQIGEPVFARPQSLLSRGWNVIWRRRVWVAVALMAAMLAVVAGFLFDRAGPDDELHKAETLLANGQPALLVPEAGRPAWFRWRLREGILNDPAEQGQVFSIRAGSELCMMELLPDPQCDSYQFTADVLHKTGERNGEVGVYCLYESRMGEKGDQACFTVWTFNDGRLIQPVVGKALLNPRSATFYQRGFCAPTSEYTGTTLLRLAPLNLINAEKPPAQWHRLAVQIKPGKVECLLDGKSAGSIERSELAATNWQRLSEFVGFRPAFPCRGSLGLCVRNGLAFFKRVQVEPTPWPGNP